MPALVLLLLLSMLNLVFFCSGIFIFFCLIFLGLTVRCLCLVAVKRTESCD
jgi:hypothetical protein